MVKTAAGLVAEAKQRVQNLDVAQTAAELEQGDVVPTSGHSRARSRGPCTRRGG